MMDEVTKARETIMDICRKHASCNMTFEACEAQAERIADAILAAQSAAPVGEEVRCHGCGSAWTDDDLRAAKAADPKIISCCPERKPLTITGWMAKAIAAEAKIARTATSPFAPQVREETITELADRRDAIAMAIYISWLNASPEDAPEHFDWYHKGKSNPKSCVHYSNVAKALKAADAVLVTFDAALTVKPGEQP